ncbi:Ycf49-like protein [Linum grandiflorum]
MAFTATATALSIFTSKPFPFHNSSLTLLNSPPPPSIRTPTSLRTRPLATLNSAKCGVAGLVGAGLFLTVIGPASAVSLPLVGELAEPANALSLPTWAVHVSSVVEWWVRFSLYSSSVAIFILSNGFFDFDRVTAMALVWQYGEKSGFETWKGLSWGMVPLLGGAMCACTWHFFYNAESLEVLVAIQAALTVIGNATMCYAAFRIFRASQEGAKDL